jgi:hypothetical protein
MCKFPKGCEESAAAAGWDINCMYMDRKLLTNYSKVSLLTYVCRINI